MTKTISILLSLCILFGCSGKNPVRPNHEEEETVTPPPPTQSCQPSQQQTCSTLCFMNEFEFTLTPEEKQGLYEFRKKSHLSDVKLCSSGKKPFVDETKKGQEEREEEIRKCLVREIDDSIEKCQVRYVYVVDSWIKKSSLDVYKIAFKEAKKLDAVPSKNELFNQCTKEFHTKVKERCQEVAGDNQIEFGKCEKWYRHRCNEECRNWSKDIVKKRAEDNKQ